MSVFVSAASFDGIGVWMSHLADWMIDAAPFWVPVVAAAAGAAAVGREMLVRSDRDRLSRAARLITIFVPPETDLASAQALWAHLMAVARPAWRRTLFGQPHLTWEYTWDRDGMRIGCWVPGSAPPNLVEAAIESAWPGARTETAWMADQDTPLPVPEDAWVAGGVLRLAEGEHYALRTEFEVDPLRGLIGAVSTIGDGETTCVQICVRPAVGRLRLSGPRRAARALHGTQTANPLSASAVGIAELALPGSANTSGARPGSTDPQATTDVRNILDKAAQPRWEVVIRYAVTTTDPGEHDEAARTARLRGRAHAVASACAIYTGRNRLARHRPRRLAQAMNTRASSRGDLMNVAELAMLAHLPMDVAVPGLTRAGARPVPAAPLLPTGGETTKILGDADTPKRPVGIRVADARRHVHMLGPTGSGKSTLLLNMILADAAARRGTVVIDPRGDLITDILDRLPADAGNRTIIIDPDSPLPGPALNPLQGPDPELAVDQLAAICRKVFAPFWGPRTDDVFRASALSLLQAAPDTATLADVPRLLTDTRTRTRIAAGLHDRTLRDYWPWYDNLGEAQQAQIIAPLLNKMRAFLMRSFVRHTIAAPTPTFTMTDVLDHGGLCLARLPQGRLGEETAHLLGSLLVAQVWQAITGRAGTPEDQRPDASLYLDEMQHFLNLPSSIEEILAEARGFHLGLVLAHQNLAQLTERTMREGVAANARTKIWFSMSPADAHDLELHVTPYLSEHDLANLDAHQVAARIMVDGTDAPPCTLRTRPPAPPIDGRAAHIRAVSAAQFGRDRRQRTKH